MSDAQIDHQRPRVANVLGDSTPRPPRADSLHLIGNFDAQAWAKEFMRLWGERLSEVDEGLMIGWFANAIMAGYDHKDRAARPSRAEVRRLYDIAADAECIEDDGSHASVLAAYKARDAAREALLDAVCGPEPEAQR
jgi:hypothetical protein